MNKRIRVGLVTALLVAGCVKEITSDERLERETTHTDASKSSTAAELARLRCDDIAGDLTKARDPNRTEEERLSTYSEVYSSLKSRTGKFEEAMARNPDLAFQEGSQDLVAVRDGCVQASADVRKEFEVLVREIMQVLVVEDVRSGNQPVKVARIDFGPLRTAIDKLELDDRDSLLASISSAEKTVEMKSSGKRPR